MVFPDRDTGQTPATPPAGRHGSEAASVYHGRMTTDSAPDVSSADDWVIPYLKGTASAVTPAASACRVPHAGASTH
jgi:hypothetical protein